jgi:hypothetical protein
VSQSSNLHKSDEGWVRFQERTGKGARARGGFMEHRPVAAVGAAVKAGKNDKLAPTPAPAEGEYVQRRGRRQRRVRIAD